LVEIDNHLDSFDNNWRRRDPEDVTDTEDLEQLDGDDNSNNESDLGSDHMFSKYHKLDESSFRQRVENVVTRYI